MPKININPQQQLAFQRIEENLKNIKVINGILERGEEKTLVVCTESNFRRPGTGIFIPEKMSKKIEAVLKQIRLDAVRDSNGLAHRFGISFSAQEQLLLDSEFTDNADPEKQAEVQCRELAGPVCEESEEIASEEYEDYVM